MKMHTLIEEFAEDDNARDENSKYEYSDGRQVDQREEPEQENSEDLAHNRRVRRTWQQETMKIRS